MQNSATPITVGIFDSGVGGLSVLRALLGEMHGTHFVYVADHGFGPYGEQGTTYVIERAQNISRFLFQTFPLELLVVACNTATAAAVKALRDTYSGFPIVGIEPAIKPAAQQSPSGHIGIMATPGTLNSASFAALQTQLRAQYSKVQFQSVACTGLAKAIEDSFISGSSFLSKKLAKQYLTTLCGMDTLVLGCTHYPFLQGFLQAELGLAVRILEPSLPVALQSKRLLYARKPLLAQQNSCAGNAYTFFSSGGTMLLQAACREWLGIHAVCHKLGSALAQY